MKKLTKKTFKEQVLNEGQISIDKDGKYVYVVAQINDENFSDISPMLKEQLINEGKYNSWIGFIEFKGRESYTVQSLPIYGDPNKYVTKWFTRTAEETIEKDLSERGRRLLKRANEYLGF